VAETLIEFPHVLVDDGSGTRYRAHACAAPMPDGKWQGWLEFMPLDGGPAIRSSRETTQPNLADTRYWATGLTAVYLDGALKRALDPPIAVDRRLAPPVFDAPDPGVKAWTPPPPNAVLDPFAVYEKMGEAMLRRQLGALAPWHLVKIVEAYNLSDEPGALLARARPAALIDRIVSGVRAQR